MAAMLKSVTSLLNKGMPFLRQTECINLTITRGRKRWLRPRIMSLYHRRNEQGPEPLRRKSEWSNWNYDAEIYAFGKRLGENFKPDTLKTAFIHRSYVEEEASKRSELGLSEEDQLELNDNDELAIKGEQIALEYIKVYMRRSLTRLPEEGIESVSQYLMSEKMLAYVANNLGVTDMILSKDFPPSDNTLSKTFKAVIGGLAQDQGVEQACVFVKDFILTQLVGESIEDLWEIVNPMGHLADLLKDENRGVPEPRLIWQTGSKSMLAAYMVGIYSDQQLIGKGPGETVTIAEEMAARDALRRYYGLSQDFAPFKYEKSHIDKVKELSDA